MDALTLVSRRCTAPFLLVAFAVMASLAMPVKAQTVDAAGVEVPVNVKKKKRKTVKRPADSSPFLYGSSETQKMRDKRLSRECKGAANGGACRGYTQ